MERLLALLATPVLAVLPLLAFVHSQTHVDPHAPHGDHRPHRGGDVVMLGDVHVEVVRTDAVVHLYLSDPVRRPLPPGEGRAVHADGSSTPLATEGDHLVARGRAARFAEHYEIVPASGAPLVVPAPP
ncbi:MAG: hypothetical protein FJ148_19235 [Deltaproteobacteria bacterium]|nr:hypothetical protein [Deltaproteobacteria bacterium]